MKVRLCALALVTVALAGCNNEKVRNLIDQRADQSAQAIQEAVHKPAPVKTYNPLKITDKVWAGSSSLRLRRGLPLPGKYEGAHDVTLVASDPMTLNEIAVAVSSQTGIPVRIAAGTTTVAMGAGGAMASGSGNDMPLAYEGPLSGLLDQVAGHFGVNWRYDGASINFSKYETRVFVIEALPGTQKVKDGIKDASAGGGGGLSGSSSSTSSLEQTSSMDVEFKVWEELSESVASMLGGVGSSIVSPSSGTLTVTTTPEIMRMVAKFVEEENKRMSRQVGINVEIYKVALKENTDFGFKFNTVLRRMADLGGNVTGLAGAPKAITGGGTLSLAILNPNTVGEVSGLFTALSSIGDTSQVAQFPMTTLNNRPVSRRIGHDRTYLASVQSEQSQTSTQVTYEGAVIPEGFSLQLTPRLLDDGRIMLQYSLSIIDIDKVDTFPEKASATQTQIQLPTTTNRVFVQQSLLKSGSTLIIGGYDDETAGQDSQGVWSPFNYLLGGGSNTMTSHTMLFMAITPQVLDVPLPEQE